MIIFQSIVVILTCILLINDNNVSSSDHNSQDINVILEGLNPLEGDSLVYLNGTWTNGNGSPDQLNFIESEDGGRQDVVYDEVNMTIRFNLQSSFDLVDGNVMSVNDGAIEQTILLSDSVIEGNFKTFKYSILES